MAFASPGGSKSLSTPVFVLGYPQSVGQGTWTHSVDSTHYFCQHVNNSVAVANGDNATWKVSLPAGTYTVRIYASKGNSRGKIDVNLNGTDIITGQDWYNGATSVTYIDATGISISKGLQDLKITVNGKNAASSNYYVYISAIEFIKTA
jgi:hypothetical protein